MLGVPRRDFPVAAPEDGEVITGALQAAIDAARGAGGGRVVVPAGTWTSGAIRLSDDIELHLPRGALLRASTDYADYAAGTVSVVAERSDRALISARGARNIAITGPGWIDGQGAAWCDGDALVRGVRWAKDRRPRIVVLEDCVDIRIADLNVRAAPMWTIHLVGCRDILVEGCEIRNDMLMPNTDGVNFDSCQDGTLRDCVIEAADDCVCMKTSAVDDPVLARPCERIEVTGCTFRSNSCAIKIGTESHRDLRDARFADCVIADSNRAFGIFSRDGGTIERVRFESSRVDCHWTPDGFWGNGEAVTINAVPRRPGSLPGEIRDVKIRDIEGTMESALNLVGLPERPLKRIAMERIDLRQVPGAGQDVPELDLRPTAAELTTHRDPAIGRENAWMLDAAGRVIGLEPYPGGLPGLWADHVDGLTCEDVSITRPTPLPARWNPNRVHYGAGTVIGAVD